jgi:hypothetical protein
MRAHTPHTSTTTNFLSIKHCRNNTRSRPRLDWHSLAPAGSTWLSKRFAIDDTRFENVGADIPHLLWAPLQGLWLSGSEVWERAEGPAHTSARCGGIVENFFCNFIHKQSCILATVKTNCHKYLSFNLELCRAPTASMPTVGRIYFIYDDGNLRIVAMGFGLCRF